MMEMRIIPQDFVDLRKSPIDLHDIETNVRNFFICLNFNHKKDVKAQCLDARNHLDNARLLLRNLVSLEENDLINRQKKAFFWMLGNLGRVDLRLNSFEEEIMDKLETQENYKDRSFPDSPKLRRYVNLLLKLMYSLVYYPLKNAFRKYSELDKEMKTKEIFEYKIFIELLNSSESLGSITSQKMTGKKRTETSGHQLEYESTSNLEDKDYNPKTDRPPEIPKDYEERFKKKNEEDDLIESLMGGELNDEDFDEVYEFN